MPFFSGTGFEIFAALTVVVSVVRLVTLVFVRQQVRSNPARQLALQEGVRYRSTISGRYRYPNSRISPSRWHYPRGNPTEVVVHDTTLQISAWSFRTRGRHFGCFLRSAQTTMWQTQMRFGPFGIMPCIVVSGSFPFRSQQRQIEVAIAPRGSLEDLWNALAASGVRAPATGGSPSAPPAYAPIGSSVSAGASGRSAFAPPSTQSTWAPASMSPPPFQQPAGKLSYKSGAWQMRRMLIVAGTVIILFPFVASLIVHAVAAHQTTTTTTSVNVIGSSAVATVSGVSCAVDSDDLTARGNITAAANTVSGLKITVEIENNAGANLGFAATTTSAPLLAGESQPFEVVVPTPNPNLGLVLCAVDWADVPPA
jgi:hypothetical protein